MDSRFLIFAISLLALWSAARIGAWFRTRYPHKRSPEVDDDSDLVLGATLTLLGLIIGFSFSMAISRYDQRKNYEEEEANAIGTEYLRADLLPASNEARIRMLLGKYLDERILFYQTRDAERLRRVDALTAELQNSLWSAAQVPALANPTPLSTLVERGD